MNKIILAFIFAGSSFVSVAQTQPVAVPYKVPVDSITKLITYEGVVEVKGDAAAVLYKRINNWFHTYYKNPSEVIRENDSVKFSITGKPRVRLTNPPDKETTKTDASIFQYTIKVTARDGRFKYELTEYNWKQASYYACEKWLDIKAKTFMPVYNDYLQQLDKTTLDAINSLKNAVTHEKSTKDKDSW